MREFLAPKKYALCISLAWAFSLPNRKRPPLMPATRKAGNRLRSRVIGLAVVLPEFDDLVDRFDRSESSALAPPV